MGSFHLFEDFTVAQICDLDCLEHFGPLTSIIFTTPHTSSWRVAE
jgi:hypothetical protein